MNTRFIIKAVNDDTDTCSCCGRQGLKRVAWVARIVEGTEYDPDPMGTTCAARMVAGERGGNEYDEARNEHAVKNAISRARRGRKPAEVWG